MTLKFLIVDDSKAMQTIVKRILSNAGYKGSDFHFADNGAEALEQIIDIKPDMVLLDWHMPEMTGLELLKKVKEQNITTKIGLVTAERNELLIQEAIAEGALFVVHKPFTVNSLKQQLIPALSSDESASETEYSDSIKRIIPQISAPQIILPSPSAISILLSTITGASVKVEKVPPLKIKNFKLPFTVSLYGDNENNIKAVQLLDSGVVDGLSDYFAKSIYKTEPYDDKLLAKSLIKALEIIAACFHNTSNSSELKFIKTYELQKIINKVASIDNVADEKRIDLCFSFENEKKCYSIICLEPENS